jgi:hypothetical protein
VAGFPTITVAVTSILLRTNTGTWAALILAGFMGAGTASAHAASPCRDVMSTIGNTQETTTFCLGGDGTWREALPSPAAVQTPPANNPRSTSPATTKAAVAAEKTPARPASGRPKLTKMSALISEDDYIACHKKHEGIENARSHYRANAKMENELSSKMTDEQILQINELYRKLVVDCRKVISDE